MKASGQRKDRDDGAPASGLKTFADTSRKRINFGPAKVLLLEQSHHGLDILSQILFGFGARDFFKATTLDEATEIARRTTIDLVILDPVLRSGDGLEFVRWLRSSCDDPNRSAPVVVIGASGTIESVMRARDAGASFFLAKPVTPDGLVDRILKVISDNRQFVITSTYVGPDRRFKREAPPPGTPLRRSTDIKGELGEASEPNLSQDDLESFFKPQKVTF